MTPQPKRNIIQTVGFLLTRRSRPSSPSPVFDLSHLSREGQLLVLLSRPSVNGILQVEIRDRLREDVNWPNLLQLAKAHGITPLIYRTIMAYGPDVVPKETREAFRRHVQASAILSTLLSEELLGLMDAFAAKGIRAIPFKGPTLGAMAYGDVALRECVDLDFIVEQSSIHHARQLMWSRGYQLTSHALADGEVHEEAFHSFVKKNGIFRVDLQWVMARRLFAFRLDREDFWRRTKTVWLDQRTIPALAPEELLIVLCLHGCKHAWEDLKWVCDVAHLVHHRRVIDWSRLLFLSRHWECRRMVLMGLGLTRALYDTPMPLALLREIESDRDVPALIKRMPSRLLKAGDEGIDEEDAEAFYLTLKDSIFEQWRYSVALCHAEVPVVTKSLSWFRLQGRLTRLYHLILPLQRVVAWCLPFLRVRKAIAKWLVTPG